MKKVLFALVHLFFFSGNSQNKNCKTIGNKVNGVYIEYDAKCRKKIESHYKNGKLDGSYTEWKDSTRVYIKGMYKNGIKIGTWRHQGEDMEGNSKSWNYKYSEFTYENGELVKAYDYLSYSDKPTPKNGEVIITYGKRKIMKHRVYDKKGQIRGEDFYINDRADSVAKVWDEKGVLQLEEYLKQSTYLKRIQYSKGYKTILVYENNLKSNLKQYDNNRKLIYEEYYNTDGKVIRQKGVKMKTNLN
jgi:antitoxin component YwqK of YwqJK toxin-antitoxin module